MYHGEIIDWLKKNPGKSFVDYLKAESEAISCKPSIEDRIETIKIFGSREPLVPS